jgi:hypothetical protein
MNNPEIKLPIPRFELSSICELTDSDQVQQQLEKLKDVYLHNISLVKSRTKFSPNLTSFEFALGLDKSQTYLSNVTKLRDLGFYCLACNHFFVAWIDGIKKFLKEVNKNEIGGAEIILYYKRFNLQQTQLKHAGIVKSKEKIISKWGTSDVYEHSILEIPEEYGSEYLIFQKPDVIEIEKWFNDYLENLAEAVKSLYTL